MSALSNYCGGSFLSDLVTRPEFLGYIQEDIYNGCKWVQSGAVVRNSALDCKAGGVSVKVPHFASISPTEEVLDSSATWGTSSGGYLTPQKITASDQIMPILHRAFSYAVDDLSVLGTGSDPMGAIRTQVSKAVNKHRTSALIAQLDGIFASALSGNAIDVSSSSTSTSTNYISLPNVVKAKNKLGERASELTTIAMHSDVYSYLLEVGALTFSSDSLSSGTSIQWGGGGFGQAQFGKYLGMNVIQDDMLAPTLNSGGSDQYDVILLGAGSIMEGEQQALRIQQDRNILSMQDTIAVDYHYGFHLGGTKYGGADGPTNTNLETSGNWTLAYSDRRLISAVKLTVNTPYSVNKA